MIPEKCSLPTLATAEKREIVAMLPLSKYLNGCPVASPAQAVLDLPGGVPAALDRDLRDARQPVERHHVADREDLRVARHRAVRVDLEPPGAVRRRARRLRQLDRQARRGDPRRPDLRHRLDALVTVAGLDLNAGLVDVDDLRARHEGRRRRRDRHRGRDPQRSPAHRVDDEDLGGGRRRAGAVDAAGEGDGRVRRTGPGGSRSTRTARCRATRRSSRWAT